MQWAAEQTEPQCFLLSYRVSKWSVLEPLHINIKFLTLPFCPVLHKLGFVEYTWKTGSNLTLYCTTTCMCTSIQTSLTKQVTSLWFCPHIWQKLKICGSFPVTLYLKFIVAWKLLVQICWKYLPRQRHKELNLFCL